MTKKEAAEIVSNYEINGCGYCHTGGKEVEEAFALAVEALEQKERKQGHWRHYEGDIICSECHTAYYDDIMEYTGDEVPKYCPDCGAKMTGAIEASEDAISKAYLEQEIENQIMPPIDKEGYWRGWNNALGKVVELIEEAPSVIPQPKEGEWIKRSYWQFETDGRGNCWHEYECPKCGFCIKGSKRNYCPNCGKRMKGADDE